MSCFQNFAADAAKKKITLRAVLINLLINQLIRINLGPNILKSYFLHWQQPIQPRPLPHNVWAPQPYVSPQTSVPKSPIHSHPHAHHR